MQDIVAMVQRHIGNVRIVLLGLDPLIAEAFELIDKTRLVVHLALVGGQLDGELTLVMAQDEFLAHVEVLLENHTSIVSLANAQLLSEELQTAEDRCFVVVDIGNQLGVDDIHAIHTTYQYQTVVGDADRTLVVRALLQTILGGKATHVEGPVALIVLLRYHVGYAILGNHPHGVLLILGNAHHAGTNQSAVHIQQRLLVVLPIHNATA